MAFLRTLTSTRLGLLAGGGASRSTIPVFSSLQHLHSTSITPQLLPVSGCHPSGYGGPKEEYPLPPSVVLRNFTHSGNPEDPSRLWNSSRLGYPNVAPKAGLFTPRLGNSLLSTGYRRVPSQMTMMLKNNGFATDSKGSKKSGSSPGRSKYPKQMKGTMKGISHQGNRIAFGAYGLQVLEHSWITSRQIEAGRRAIIQTSRRTGTQSVRGGGKIWVRVFPDKPVTKKPTEVRMGRGKGSHAYFVAVVKPGRILYEMNGVTETTARRAISIAASKMPIRTQFISLGR